MFGLLSGQPVDMDKQAAPVGAFDIIRGDVRRLSTVQPVDRIYMERTSIGYRGILYSHEKPFMFALNTNGFTAKGIEDAPSVLAYCAKLEDSEQRYTADLDEVIESSKQKEFNARFSAGSSEPSVAAIPEEGPIETITPHGPRQDVIVREPGAYRQMFQGNSLREGKELKKVCGGAIVVNKQGKVLLVKPTNGYGGYDWTFPKGYPAQIDPTTAATAMREAKEETGYSAKPVKFVGQFLHNDGGLCDYYECELANNEPTLFDEDETEAVKWCSLVEALELLNDSVDVQILGQANALIPRLLLKGSNHTGTMVALHIPLKIAKTITTKVGDAEDAKDLHITLAYLGKDLSDSQKKGVLTAARQWASRLNKLSVKLHGIGRFPPSKSSEGRDVVYMEVHSEELMSLRKKLVDDLVLCAQCEPKKDFAYTPHVTLTYLKPGAHYMGKQWGRAIDVTFDSVGVSIGGKRVDIKMRKRKVSTPDVKKALPKMSDEQREESTKKVGAKPLKAGSKEVGSTGKVRYGYPGEEGGDKQPSGKSDGAPAAAGGGEGAQAQAQEEPPHPDLTPPAPDQAPVTNNPPDQAHPADGRAPDPTKTQAKHTVNLSELCAELHVKREVLQTIAERIAERPRFVKFMSKQMEEFSEEHGLDGDYWGLVFDVLTNKVQEGASAADQHKEAAAQAK